MSKKHHKAPPPRAVPAPAALEAQARVDLAEGRFRKARDAYKTLCKQDREKYLPGLIDANRRLAAQLLELGQRAEAEQVLAYLKTIAPPEIFHGMDLHAALTSADWPKAAALAAGILEATGSRVAEEDLSRAADALVLAFPEAAEPAAPRLPDSLKAELGAILGALERVSAGAFDHAQELLRPLPRASVFASWKILVKGMIAFHAGEAAKAETLFAQLPENGAPHRAAAAYRFALGSTPPKAQLPAAMEGACALFGAPGIARVLPRAHRLWVEGQHVQSYREMRAAPEFPAEEPNLAGELSAFYFKIACTLREKAMDRYLDAFFSREKTGSWKNAAEGRWTLLMLASSTLDFAPGEAEADPEELWRKFLRACPGEETSRARLTARVLERLGRYYLEGTAELSPHAAKPKIWREDAEDAVPLLRESIACDVTYLLAYLRLLTAYEALGEKREQQRLLEAMTRQFPNEKAVLQKAGSVCLQHQAFAQGLGYLERAHKLDPLDQSVLADLVLGYTEFAEEQYQKPAPEKARQTFEKLLLLAEREKIDLQRGRDFLMARQGVLEMLFGDKAAADRLLAAAREATRALPALLLFAHCYHRRHLRKSKKTPFWTELQQHSPATAAARRSVYLAFRFARELDERLDLGREEKFVVESLAPVAGAAFTIQEAEDLLDLWQRDRTFLDLATKFVRIGLQAAPQNLRFRLFSFLLRPHPPSSADLQEIEQIRELAFRQGDLVTAQIATDALAQARSFIMRPPDLYGDDYDDGFAVDDFGSGEPVFGGAPSDLDDLFSPDLIEGLRQAMETMSTAEFMKFCKKALKGIPKPIFDRLMDKVAGGQSPPKRGFPPFPRENEAKPKPRPDKTKPAAPKPPAPALPASAPPAPAPPAPAPPPPASASGQLELF